METDEITKLELGQEWYKFLSTFGSPFDYAHSQGTNSWYDDRKKCQKDDAELWHKFILWKLTK